MLGCSLETTQGATLECNCKLTPPAPGFVFLYNLKLDVVGLGGYCGWPGWPVPQEAARSWAGVGVVVMGSGGLRAEARANRCARHPGGSCTAASGWRGVRPSHRARHWPARPLPRGERRKRGGKLRLSSPLLTFQRPRLAAPRMRPTQPPASRCGRPRGWARATKGAGGAGDCAKSPLGSRTRCARIPGRCDRIPSRGLGTPSHEVRPRAGLGWRSRKAAPYPAGPLRAGAMQARPAAPEPAFAPWRRWDTQGAAASAAELSCPQQHWAPPEVTPESGTELGTREASGLGEE